MGHPLFFGLKPWAGLIAGFGAAALHQQLISDVLHFDCRLGHANLSVGIAALIIIGAGSAISWRVLRNEPGSEQSRRFVSQLSLLAAAISALLVSWMTLAGWILPACVR